MAAILLPFVDFLESSGKRSQRLLLSDVEVFLVGKVQVKTCVSQVKVKNSNAASPPPAVQRRRPVRSCALCKAAGRPGSETHYLRRCHFRPEADRRFMTGIRLITNYHDDAFDEADDDCPTPADAADTAEHVCNSPCDPARRVRRRRPRMPHHARSQKFIHQGTPGDRVQVRKPASREENL